MRSAAKLDTHMERCAGLAEAQKRENKSNKSRPGPVVFESLQDSLPDNSRGLHPSNPSSLPLLAGLGERGTGAAKAHGFSSLYKTCAKHITAQ